MKKIGLLMVGLLLFAQAEFKRGANDLTVINTETQLEWQDSYTDDNTLTKLWEDAITYCENLELDNKKDWNLPNINELKTIIVDTQYAPTIDIIFKNKESEKYWSSTEYKKESYQKWVVDFKTAKTLTIDFKNRAEYNYIRCVRDAD